MKIIIILLLFTYAYCIGFELKGVRVREAGDDKYTISGSVEYKNKKDCERRRDYVSLVCLLYDGEITTDIFHYYYNSGSSLNCNGDKLDPKRVYISSNPKYLGCCLVDDRDYEECQVYSISFPIWAIISIVVVVLLFVVVFSLLYYKRKCTKKVISTEATLL